jgi:hypothetical protein
MSDYMDQELQDAYDARYECEDWADYEEREGCFDDDGLADDDDGEEILL